MDIKLQERLFKKYDYMFRERHLDMNQSPMFWGIQCGNGWIKVIDKMCSKIQKHLNKNYIEDFAITTIKEKFGLLRVYANYGDDAIDKIIDDAEKESGKTCEACGKKGKISKHQGWLSCLCPKCLKEKK